MKIAFIIAHKTNNVVVLFATLKVQLETVFGGDSKIHETRGLLDESSSNIHKTEGLPEQTFA